MKIPTTLKIGGHIYTIEQVERVDTTPGENNCGDCELQNSRIRIKKGMPQSQKEETLLHEILHALDTEMPEKQVNNLGFKLYQVLADNNLLK